MDDPTWDKQAAVDGPELISILQKVTPPALGRIGHWSTPPETVSPPAPEANRSVSGRALMDNAARYDRCARTRPTATGSPPTSHSKSAVEAEVVGADPLR